MFAKLKKKLEDEVGDLTAPLQNALNDRRVSSSQTPSQVSRQSSVGSLIDLDGSSSASHPRGASSLQPPLTPGSSGSSGEPHPIGEQIKKLNNEWNRKFEALKKSYEEKIQNSDADFAWKLSSKNEEMDKLREEKRRLEDSLKTIELKFKDKLIRAQDENDHLEGMTKMENSKVKHLLLNAQEEMETLRAANYENEDKIAQLQSQMQVLKAENELLNKNLDKTLVGKGVNNHQEPQELEEIKAKHSRLQEEFKQLKESKEKALEDSAIKIQGLESLKDQLQAQIGSLNDSLTSLKDSSAQTMSKFKEEYKNVNQELQNKLKSTEAENSRLSNEYKSILVQFETLKGLSKSLEDINVKYASLEAELFNKKEEIERLEADNCDLVVKLDGLKEEVSTLKGSAPELEAELSKLREIKKNLEGALSDNESKVKALEKSNSELSNQLKSKEEDFENVKRGFMEESKTSGELQANLHQIKAELGKVQEESKSLQNENVALKVELESLQNTTESSESEAELSRLKELNRKLEGALRKNESKVKAIEESNSIISNQLKSKEEALKVTERSKEELQVKLDQIQSEFGKEKNHKGSLQVELENLKKSQESLKAESDASKSELVHLKETKVNLSALNEKLMARVAEAESTNKSLRRELEESLVQKSQDAEGRERELQGRLQEVEVEAAIIREANHDLNATLDKLKEDLKMREGDIESLRAENKGLIDDLKARGIVLEEFKKKSALAESAFENEKISFQKELDGIKGALEEEVRAKGAFEDEIVDLTLAKGDLETKCAQLESDNQNLREELDSLVGSVGALEEIEKSGEEFQAKFEVLQSQLVEVQGALERAEGENNDYLVQVSDLQNARDELREEVEFLKGEKPEMEKRLQEFEIKLAEKERALKVSHQQLQDLRKSLAQELKSGSGPETNNVPLTGSPPAPVLEIGQSEMHHPKRHTYQDDANFQYMRSVLVKYITSRDVHVTRHMRKVVSTLLQLNPDEERLLIEASEGQKTVFSSILKS